MKLFEAPSQMLSDSSTSPIYGANTNVSELKPATFGQRITAGIIDFIFNTVFIFGLGQLCSTSKGAAQILVVPLALGGFLYSSIAHALYGGRIGNMVIKRA